MAAEESFAPDLSFWGTLTMMVMLGLALVVIIIARVAYARITREHEKQRQAEIEHQKELLANSIRIQERERQRIAGNLHDDLSSKLSVLKLQLYGLKDGDLNDLPGALGLLDRVIDSSRNISHELYPPLLKEFGLVETVREFLEPLSGPFEIAFEVKGDAERTWPLEDQLQVFRLLQELINNAVKHAEATELNVQLEFEAEGLMLVVEDNGKGYDRTTNRTGLGMLSMESRVQLLQGTIKFSSRQGEGTTATINMPWKTTLSD